ncbi:arylsulfatase [Algoriphagus lutimaris]|uniref:arylsulfatase n=1 Tax=Algoriphagus lutimaris TaxID=613197 RepID=UPI00196B1427|nr:arylsulfatase [Algoriphagus lutimaris]MBN3520110.1 arylsulfatase [Algoriphagus lutimaris]
MTPYTRLVSIFLTFLILHTNVFSQNTPPNIILVITDDQGYGDFGFTGNPHISTPTLDQLAQESVEFTNFYVSPVCAPTRSSLMTGRYSLRTGIRDTYNGGAMMSTEEITIAELLKKKHYVTGIFGKWHLGDNFPMRPSDQGFDESLIHLSGGMGQVGDFTTYYQGNRSYFDPVLWHNNQQQSYQGYCSDIFTEEAIKFIENNKDQPFFTYLSFNAPHTPLQVPDEYYQKYKDLDPSEGFGEDGKPFYPMSESQKEDARKVYAMVENIDDNLNKLFSKLEELEIDDRTIIIFLTDNGPQQQRYVSGLRGLKGNVFQGGVRAPLLIHYPEKYQRSKKIDQLTAHLDILPTIAEVVGIDLPNDRKIDGKSLIPLMNGDASNFQNRSFFSYWNRKYPERYNNISIQNSGWKLVGKTDYQAPLEDFELYNLTEDPYEQTNLISTKTSKGRELKIEMDEFYEELIQEKHLVNQPLIQVGFEEENPVFLNRNDAAGQRGIWAQEEIYGYWNVLLASGTYDFTFKFVKDVPSQGTMYLETGPIVNQTKIESEGEVEFIEMKDIQLPEMKTQIIPFYQVNGKQIFPFWVEIHKK